MTKTGRMLHVFIKLLAATLLLIGIILIKHFGIYNIPGTSLVIVASFIMIFVKPSNDYNNYKNDELSDKMSFQ